MTNYKFKMIEEHEGVKVFYFDSYVYVVFSEGHMFYGLQAGHELFQGLNLQSGILAEDMDLDGISEFYDEIKPMDYVFQTSRFKRRHGALMEGQKIYNEIKMRCSADYLDKMMGTKIQEFRRRVLELKIDLEEMKKFINHLKNRIDGQK